MLIGVGVAGVLLLTSCLCLLFLWEFVVLVGVCWLWVSCFWFACVLCVLGCFGFAGLRLCFACVLVCCVCCVGCCFLVIVWF